MPVFDAATHAALVAALQDEYLADDLAPPDTSLNWSEARLRAWFESGGAEAEPPAAVPPASRPSTSLKEGEHLVEIPYADGKVLQGKLTWPGGEFAEVGLLWCPGNPAANPHFDYWGETMDSPLISAMASSVASGEHTSNAKYAFLRFDYTTTLPNRTNRGGYSDLAYPPYGAEEAVAAMEFLRAMCRKVAVGGHNVGASHAVEAALSIGDGLLALVSINHAPDVHKFIPAAMQKMANGKSVQAEMERGVRSLPAGVPKLYLAASGDPVSPPASLQRYVDWTPKPAEMAILENTLFTLKGREAEIARTVLRFVHSAN